MDIEKLAYICHSARSKEYINGGDAARVCVILNRKTYIKLFDALRASALILPLEGLSPNTFTFYGCLVSWSPMHDEDPANYSAGTFERAH